MTLQNRVLPTGEIVALAACGLFTGNRGIIHRPDGTLGVSRWTHKHWLVCSLTHPRGRHHGAMPDRGWTALFFLDEAVALSAGHRPCHYCRRDACHAYFDAWAEATGTRPRRLELDSALHRARVTRTRDQVRHDAPLDGLPDHAFVRLDGRPFMVSGKRLLPFLPERYGTPVPRPAGIATVLTPRPVLEVLRSGYRPVLHPSAQD